MQVDLDLRYNFVNAKDKQNWKATLWLADLRLARSGGVLVVTPVSTLRDTMMLQPEFYGNYLYTELMHHYLRIFAVKGRTPAECVSDAAWCITFLGRWQQSLALGRHGTRPCGSAPRVRLPFMQFCVHA